MVADCKPWDAQMSPDQRVVLQAPFAMVQILEEDMPVPFGEGLEALLGCEGRGSQRAMIAANGDGPLQGVVRLTQVRLALRPAK